MNKVSMRILVYEADGEANDNFLIDYNFKKHKKYFEDIETNDLYQKKKYLDIAKYSYFFYAKIVDEFLLIYKAFRNKNTRGNRGGEHDVLELSIPKNISIQELLKNELINDFLLNEDFKELFEKKYKNNYKDILNKINLIKYRRNEEERKEYKGNIFIKNFSPEFKKLFLTNLMTLPSNQTSFLMSIGDLDKEIFIRKVSLAIGSDPEISNYFYDDKTLLQYFKDNEKYQNSIIEEEKKVNLKEEKENQKINETPSDYKIESKLYAQQDNLLKEINMYENNINKLETELYQNRIELSKKLKEYNLNNDEIIKFEDNRSLRNKIEDLLATKGDIIFIILVPSIILAIVYMFRYLLIP